MSERLILTIGLMGGTGQLGPGLALRWANAGYQVIIGSRQAEKAARVAAELNEMLGLETIQGMQNEEAAQRADICVLTVNHSAHQATLESLKDVLQGKIVVDTTARVDYRDPRPPSAPSAARMAQEVLGPECRVVAAFQTVPANRLKKEPEEPLDLDVLVCADDPEAAEEVCKLAQGAGMRAYYAGDLDFALVAEGLTAMLIAMNKHYQARDVSLRIAGLEGE